MLLNYCFSLLSKFASPGFSTNDFEIDILQELGYTLSLHERKILNWLVDRCRYQILVYATKEARPEQMVIFDIARLNPRTSCSNIRYGMEVLVVHTILAPLAFLFFQKLRCLTSNPNITFKGLCCIAILSLTLIAIFFFFSPCFCLNLLSMKIAIRSQEIYTTHHVSL